MSETESSLTKSLYKAFIRIADLEQRLAKLEAANAAPQDIGYAVAKAIRQRRNVDTQSPQQQAL